MVHTLHRLSKFLQYQKRAKSKYYLHSPFLYQFYLNVLESTDIEALHKLKYQHTSLLNSQEIVQIEDMGAIPGSTHRRVADLARTASMPQHYGKVLYNLVKYFKPHTILELGTCLGVGTSYLSSASPTAAITTIEGSRTLSNIAKQNFETWGLSNITTLHANFDELLPKVLASSSPFDLVFIDGNHRYEPTLRYFHLLIEHAQSGTILIFDDIYWSKEMTNAWQTIKADPRISLTIDIYRFGICFLRHESLAKEDFVLRY